MGEINKFVNGEPKKRPPTATEFVAEKIYEFQKTNERMPHVILMSPDLMKDCYKEFKAMGLKPRNAPPFSIALILREPITFMNVEVALIGGDKRMALI